MWKDFKASYGHLSGLVYIVFQIFQVVISVMPVRGFPGGWGYLFGPLWGIDICCNRLCFWSDGVAFGLARVLGQGFVQAFLCLRNSLANIRRD